MGKALRKSQEEPQKYPAYQIDIAIHILQHPTKIWNQYLLLKKTLATVQTNIRKRAIKKGEDPNNIKISRALPNKVYRSTPGLGLTPEGKKRNLRKSPDLQMDTATVIHLVNIYKDEFETMEDLIANAQIIAEENAPENPTHIKEELESGSYHKATNPQEVTKTISTPIQDLSNNISEKVTKHSSDNSNSNTK